MRPRASTVPPALCPAVVVTVLSGWGAADRTLDRDEDERLFELYQSRHEGIARLWTAHEAFLRAEARRLGIKPAWTYGRRRRFFGEYCVLQERAKARRDADDDDPA